MQRLVFVPIAIALLAGGGKCEATTPGESTAPDKVISKRIPKQSSKNCWEIRILVDGREDKFEVRCVDKATWDKYKPGDTYP